MPKHLNRFTVPSICALALASFTIAACGGGDSGDDAASNLAKYVPADAPVYIEGSLRPDQELADDVDTISTKLVGESLSDTIESALSEDQNGDISYADDVEPWLGENAAMYVDGGYLDDESMIGGDAAIDKPSGSDPTAALEDISPDDIGLIAESTDVDASEAFIDKAADEQGKTSDEEYEGFSYKLSLTDNSVLGIVDDNVVFASSETVFKAMVDASKGDSLQGDDSFSELIDKAADGSLGNLYVANGPVATPPASGTGGFDITEFYTALGISLEQTGSLASLVPTEEEISIVGVTNAETGFESGDATDVIETFPANSLFAIGSGDIGRNATTIIDALDEQGIKGLFKPGDLKKNLQESSQGFDVLRIVESLQTIGFFVSGDTPQNLGGALVVTTSDPEPLDNALGAFSQLIAFAGDSKVKPLGGGMTGFSVKTPELPGRPIVIALEGDRLVVGVGVAIAKQALTGKGETLAGSAAFKAATESLDGESVDLFGDPSAVATLIEAAAGSDPSAKELTDILEKFEFMVAGSGSDEETSEFNLGLKD